MSSPFLSKSKYLTGLQCPKLLWYHYNAKNQLPEVDEHTQAIFDQGHQVGELAKKLFPDGIDIDWEIGFDQVIKESQALLKNRKPLFEAGFMSNNTYARADILNPVENDRWDIIEVKSTTQVKDINYHDLALQKYCYEGAGVPINRCHLMHINNQYVRQGEIELEKLFVTEDITAEVERHSEGIEQRLKEMLDVIAQPKCPDMRIGPHCNDPYSCILQALCWEFLPDDSIFSLYRMRKEKAFELVDSGCLSIDSVPGDFALSANQSVQYECAQTGEPHIDRQAINDFLNTLQFPRCYLDFETFGSAIPPFNGSKPYQQIPFQFSLHVCQEYDSEPAHHSFLADSPDDPRPRFLEKLRELLGNKGSIIVYNQGFELGRLNECAEFFPEYRDWLESNIRPRFIDLLAPFRAFYYYNPLQNGSASIKKVLPALCGESYEGMEIADGGAASREFARVTFTDVDEDDRQRVRTALENYCELDTQAMIDIVNKLTRICT